MKKNQLTKHPLLGHRIPEFRIWSLLNGKFVTIIPIDYFVNPKTDTLNEIFQNTNFVFQQFTGLLDKNGKKIFEGDIIKCFNFDNTVSPFFVKYIDCSFQLVNLKEQAFTQDILDYRYTKYLKIIGNVFESPKLTKYFI